MKTYEEVRAALEAVVDAYVIRFETGAGRLFGPIDDEIVAAQRALGRTPHKT